MCLMVDYSYVLLLDCNNNHAYRFLGKKLNEKVR